LRLDKHKPCQTIGWKRTDGKGTLPSIREFKKEIVMKMVIVGGTGFIWIETSQQNFASKDTNHPTM